MSEPTDPASVPLDNMPQAQSKMRCYCTIVPDVDGGTPEMIESDSLDAFKAELYLRLLRFGAGWCFPIINGQRATLSVPRQVFQLKLADGTLTEVADPGALVFEANGRFTTLKSAVPVL